MAQISGIDQDDASMNKPDESPNKSQTQKWEPKIKKYRVQGIFFENQPSYRVLQDQGGPCPLIGICNVMLLRNDIRIHNRSTKEVPYTMLTKCLEDHLQRLFEKNFLNKQDTTEDQMANAIKNIEDCVAFFPKLEDGLDINIIWDDCDRFEFTPQVAMFDSYSIRLVHGWVVDPQDKELHRIIGKLSYNETVDWLTNDQYDKSLTKEDIAKIEADKQRVREFLQNYSHQLTEYGLQRIFDHLGDRQLAILFRNNHFACIYKRNNTLFELCTDEGIIDADYRITWQTLSGVYGDTQYAENDFRIMGGFEINASQHYESKPYIKDEMAQMDDNNTEDKPNTDVDTGNPNKDTSIDNKNIDKTTTSTDDNTIDNANKNPTTSQNGSAKDVDMDHKDASATNKNETDKDNDTELNDGDVAIVKSVDTNMESENKIEENDINNGKNSDKAQSTQQSSTTAATGKADDEIDEATRQAIAAAQMEDDNVLNDLAVARMIEEDQLAEQRQKQSQSGRIAESDKRQIEQVMGWKPGDYDVKIKHVQPPQWDMAELQREQNNFLKLQKKHPNLTFEEYQRLKHEYKKNGKKDDESNCNLM